jgi:polysaccharide export outer membrane protein
MKVSYKSIIIIFLLPVLVSLASCINTKQVTYFNDAADTAYIDAPGANENIIHNNDILSITINSLNAEASAVFNTTNNFVINSSTASGSATQSTGYLVNIDGSIQLPILGNIKAAGLTKTQLKDLITQTIISKKLLVDPVVNIRHLNFEVTVIGEVGRPTVITVPNEKISMIKALGLAGDITIYGQKNNVLLIRESSGRKKLVRLDLQSTSFIKSPYYYLMPNDVVYVETNKNRIASVSRGHQLIPSLLYTLSVVAVIIINRVN